MSKPAATLIAIGFVGSLALHAFLNVSLGLAFLIFFVGWPIVGTLVTIDDDMESGWSNPDGTVRPPWLQVPFWGQIVAGLAISAAGAAVDAGWTSQASVWFWLLAAAGLAVAVPMIKRGLRAHDG